MNKYTDDFGMLDECADDSEEIRRMQNKEEMECLRAQQAYSQYVMPMYTESYCGSTITTIDLREDMDWS